MSYPHPLPPKGARVGLGTRPPPGGRRVGPGVGLAAGWRRCSAPAGEGKRNRWKEPGCLGSGGFLQPALWRWGRLKGISPTELLGTYGEKIGPWRERKGNGVLALGVSVGVILAGGFTSPVEYSSGTLACFQCCPFILVSHKPCDSVSSSVRWEDVCLLTGLLWKTRMSRAGLGQCAVPVCCACSLHGTSLGL